MSLSRSTYLARRAACVCVVCTEPTSGTALCADCRSDMQERAIEVRTSRLSSGRCTLCGSDNAGSRFRLCDVCRQIVRLKRRAQLSRAAHDDNKPDVRPVSNSLNGGGS